MTTATYEGKTSKLKIGYYNEWLKYRLRCKKHSYSLPCDAGCNECSYVRKAKHKMKDIFQKASFDRSGKAIWMCEYCRRGTVTPISAIKTVKLSATKGVYNGKNKTPRVIVKDYDGNTISSKYYKVTYPKSRKNVGRYKVIVKFKKKYEGTKTLYFTIRPPKVSGLKLKSTKSGQLKISWKRDKTVSGYKIKYATKKNFENAKSIKVKSYKTTKETIKNLKSKRTYYVKVCTFKKVNGKTYYSSYCNPKKVKIK